jgi:hypothetical protein
MGGNFACPVALRRLAECKGPVYGPNSSHSAEATAMLLSGARFAHHHLATFTRPPFPIRLHCFSDNNGLITRINQHHQYNDCYPTATLAPDWDLVEELFVATSNLDTTPSFQHVLGHQD